MKLISLNIELNKHLDLIFPFLQKEKPDVLCLQEVLEEDIPKIQELLNYDVIFKPCSYATNEYYLAQRGKRLGVAIFAKKINSSGFDYYVGKEENINKPFSEYNKEDKNKVVVWVDIFDEKNNLFKIATTHLPVTDAGESTPYQLMTAESLLKSLEKFDEIILCGDMNAPRGNKTFTLLNSKYADNIPFEYKTSIDQNIHRVHGLMYMVDCLFTTPAYKTSDVKLVDGLSDHMAIVANIEKK